MRAVAGSGTDSAVPDVVGVDTGLVVGPAALLVAGRAAGGAVFSTGTPLAPEAGTAIPDAVGTGARSWFGW